MAQAEQLLHIRACECTIRLTSSKGAVGLLLQHGTMHGVMCNKLPLTQPSCRAQLHGTFDFVHAMALQSFEHCDLPSRQQSTRHGIQSVAAGRKEYRS